MPVVKLHFAPGACSLAPHILLHETGIAFTSIAAKTSTGRQAAFIEGFAQINAKMRVPALTLDGDTITENPAVLSAIAELAPDKNLLGATPRERLRVCEWMAWLAADVHAQGFAGWLRPERFSDEGAAYAGIRKKGFEHIRTCFGVIEGKLDGVYAVGGKLTAVDPYLFVFYRWGCGMEIQMDVEYPKYTALVKNLVDRPAVKAALSTEGIRLSL